MTKKRVQRHTNVSCQYVSVRVKGESYTKILNFGGRSLWNALQDTMPYYHMYQVSLQYHLNVLIRIGSLYTVCMWYRRTKQPSILISQHFDQLWAIYPFPTMFSRSCYLQRHQGKYLITWQVCSWLKHERMSIRFIDWFKTIFKKKISHIKAAVE